MNIIIDKEYINYIKDKRERDKEKSFLSIDNRYNKFGTSNKY
jgi:hypothetical protein